MIMFYTRAIDVFSKLLTPGMRRMLSNSWSQLSKRFPKHYRLLLLMVSSWRKKVSLFFWRCHALWVQNHGTQDGSKCKASSLGTVMVPEGNMQVSYGESQPTVLPSYDSYEPQWSALNHNSRLQVWHTYLGGNQHLLIGLKTSTRVKSCLVLQT